MNCTEIEDRHDCEIVYVHGATVSVLANLLDTSIPWVWILGHRPNRFVQWWETTVPLNTSEGLFTGSVRDMSFDFQMLTADFVSRSIDFNDYGLVLIQSRQQMPDTLCLERIPELQKNKVLMQNGAILRIFLPHAIETAQVQSFRKGYLTTIIGP